MNGPDPKRGKGRWWVERVDVQIGRAVLHATQWAILKSGCGINEGSEESGDFVANECRYNRCSYDYIRYLHLNSMRTRNVG